MSVYNTGTLTFTSGLVTASGYGTFWNANAAAGNLIMKRGAGVAYTVAGILSDTILSLNTTYPGPTESGLTYDLIKDFTVNANLPKPYGADRSDWPVIWADGLDKMDNWSLGWNETPFTCTFASATTFACSADKTSLFTAGTRLKIVHGGGTTYHNIVSSAYTSVTTVTIDGIITTPISKVYHSLIIGGSSGSASASITFPATQVPSAGANTLDDYEEGTFEVTLGCGTSGTITLAAGTEGVYTKTGRVVTALINAVVDSVSSPVGRLTINGFPFTSAVLPSCGSVWATALNSGYGAVLQFDIEVGTNSAYIDRYSDGTIITDVAAAIKAGSILRIMAFYFTS